MELHLEGTTHMTSWYMHRSNTCLAETALVDKLVAHDDDSLNFRSSGSKSTFPGKAANRFNQDLIWPARSFR
jgi:hypothetical protein